MRRGLVLSAAAAAAAGLLIAAGAARADDPFWRRPRPKNIFPGNAPGFGFTPTVWRPWVEPVGEAPPTAAPAPAGDGAPFPMPPAVTAPRTLREALLAGWRSVVPQPITLPATPAGSPGQPAEIGPHIGDFPDPHP